MRYPNLRLAAKEQLASFEDLINEIKTIIQDNDDERY